MRTKVWSVMTVAALGLAGCGGSQDASQSASDNPATTQQAAPVPNKVSGTVSLRDAGYKLSPAAKLQIDLIDNSAKDAAPLASKTVDPLPSLPQSFELDFDPGQIKPADTYLVKVTLTDGERNFTMPIQSLVLTNGNPAQVTIAMVAEKTAGEKLLDAFRNEQSQIGGMKMSQGSKLDGPVARGWQVFRKAGQVVFIRENADAGDKGGFTLTDYSYQDGKPLVVEQKKKANQGAAVSATNRAGWDADGKLVLKQHDTGGGQVDALSDGDAADLKKQAQYIYGLAGGGKAK